MLNALQKADGKRKLWAVPGRSVLLLCVWMIMKTSFCSGDENMYQSIISNYEERQKVCLEY